MSNLTDKLRQIRSLVQEVVDGVNKDSLVDAIEVGATLVGIVRTANNALSGIKDTLRTAALTRLKNRPGTEDFEGSSGLIVSVIVARPTLRVLKSIDMAQLQHGLGSDQFNQLFETKVIYKPRPGLRDRILEMPSGDLKNTLLLALEETPNTPRVSFPKR